MSISSINAHNRTSSVEELILARLKKDEDENENRSVLSWQRDTISFSPEAYKRLQENQQSQQQTQKEDENSLGAGVG